MPPAEPGPGQRPRAIDALLVGYAAGTLEPHLHALIESHLILSDENRGFVRGLESLVGEEIDEIAPKPLAPAGRDHILAAIYAGGWYGAPRPEKFDPDLPEPIDRLVRSPLANVPWRFAAPGIREHLLHQGDVTVSLLKIKPGAGAPPHTHDGLEVTLVLKGAFSDATGVYARGDVSVADGALDHRPVALKGEPCVCFVVTDAPLKLTGPIGRLIQKAFGK